MKKNFNFYVIAWALLLIVFNIAAFVTPAWQTLEKYTPSFWIGYIFVSLSFLGQLVCAWFAFKDTEAKKQFYNVSLFATSYAGLIASVVVGVIFMIIPVLPYWIGAIVCPLVLAVNVIAVFKAKVAIELVTAVDEKVERQTAFIEGMKDAAENLLARAANEEVKAICKKILDAFKYSDPMSVDALAEVETTIKARFEAVKQAALEGEMEMLAVEKDELLALIAERNSKCKALK